MSCMYPWILFATVPKYLTVWRLTAYSYAAELLQQQKSLLEVVMETEKLLSLWATKSAKTKFCLRTKIIFQRKLAGGNYMGMIYQISDLDYLENSLTLTSC